MPPTIKELQKKRRSVAQQDMIAGFPEGYTGQWNTDGSMTASDGPGTIFVRIGATSPDDKRPATRVNNSKVDTANNLPVILWKPNGRWSVFDLNTERARRELGYLVGNAATPRQVSERVQVSAEGRNIKPGRVRVWNTGTLELNAEAFTYVDTNGDLKLWEPSTLNALDIVSLVPAAVSGVDQGCWVYVALNPDATTPELEAFDGTAKAAQLHLPGDVDWQDIVITDGYYPLDPVWVQTGDTTITNDNRYAFGRLLLDKVGDNASTTSLPNFGSPVTKTLAGDVASAGSDRNLVIAAESSTTDNLIEITGLSVGDEVILRADSGDTITVKHNDAGATDKILLYNATDLALSGDQTLKLVKVASGKVTQYVDEKGGTGGGGNDLIPAFTPPVNGSFSWANQGSSSVTVTSDRIFLEGQVGTNEPRVRYKAAPSTPYVVTAAIIPFLNENANTEVGICWYDTGSGKLTGAAISNGRLIVKIDFTLPSTFNAVAAINADSLLYCPCIWLRIADDGTDRTASYSADGYNFRVLYTGTRTTFLTPDSVGFYVDARTSNAGVTLLSWEES